MVINLSRPIYWAQDQLVLDFYENLNTKNWDGNKYSANT